MALPDFFVIGAPKAGTTAVHAALARHPQLYLSPVKEPKFFLCDGAPPARIHGPGDAHSAQEWVWERDRYEALFDAAPAGALRGESTAFYLYDPAAHDRLARAGPGGEADRSRARPDRPRVLQLDAPLVRRPRAHLRLREPRATPSATGSPQGGGCSGTTAGSGSTASSWSTSSRASHASRCTSLRYRELVDDPQATLDGICAFLGIDRDRVDRGARREHASVRPPRAEDTRRRADRARRRIARATLPTAGVAAREHAAALGAPRQRRGPTAARHATRVGRLVDYYTDDVRRLGAITGDDYTDWLGDQGAGEYSVRRSWAPSERVTS